MCFKWYSGQFVAKQTACIQFTFSQYDTLLLLTFIGFIFLESFLYPFKSVYFLRDKDGEMEWFNEVSTCEFFQKYRLLNLQYRIAAQTLTTIQT